MIRTYHWKDSRCSDEVEPIIEAKDQEEKLRQLVGRESGILKPLKT